MEITARELNDIVKGEIVGNENVVIHNFNKIEYAKSGDLTFFANVKYESFVYTTKASVILVSNDFVPQRELCATIIKVENVYATLALLFEFVDKEQKQIQSKGIDNLAVVRQPSYIGTDVYISAFAYVEESAKIGNRTIIYPHVYVGKNVVIGDDCVIYPNTTIYHSVKIGNRCIIHAGAVIGADGFGFAPQMDGYKKIPQIGDVIIEDNVEIGANTCIDRASLGSTIIRKGVKLDNLIQIAHNCSVGEHTVLASQTGMAGSSSIGQWCQAGGQTGIAGHLKIGDRVNIGGQTGILGDIESDRNIFGSPAMDLSVAKKSFVIMPKLPEMWKKLSKLEKNIETIEDKINNI